DVSELPQKFNGAPPPEGKPVAEPAEPKEVNGESSPSVEAESVEAESVEASLEDFISQANASFPSAADGWDLHTGDVELLDEGASPVTTDPGLPRLSRPGAEPFDQMNVAVSGL